MRKLNLSAVTTAVGAPFKKGSIDFIQQSYSELISAILQTDFSGLDSTKIYILYGCVLTSSGGTTFISAGAVFCNGEVYLSPAQSIADPTGSNVVVCNLKITQYTSGTSADAVTFTDLAPRNIHDIRTVEYVGTGLTGTGNLNGGASVYNDFSELIPYKQRIEVRGISPDGDTVNFKSNQTIIYTVSPAGGGIWVDLNIDFDDAIVGAEILMQIPKTGSGGSWNVSPVGTLSGFSVNDIPQTVFSITAATVIVVKIKFLGIIGNDIYTTTSFHKY